MNGMNRLHSRRFLRRALAVAMIAGLTLEVAAQTPLNAQESRISDEAIHADLSTYEATQDRIQSLNDAGRPVRDYHLSKAQCWLDVSFHEYSRNDRSDFPQQALNESDRLIASMENGVEPLPTETPLVNESKYLRDDLWRRLRAIHGTSGFECAQPKVACGEVELVHAGNEFNQQQWRHSKPYIQIAEDLVNDAEELARQCAVEPPAPLIANVLFEFDLDQIRDIRSNSLESVDRALASIAKEDLKLVSVELVGHADRMRGRASAYNRALSERRALTVGKLLIQRGIDASLFKYEYRGDSEQVQACENVRPRTALLECLLPNRRVEVRFIVVDR